MTAGYWDRYGRNATVCHRLPPLVKLLLTIAVVAIGLSLPVQTLQDEGTADPFKFWPLHGLLITLVFVAHTLAGIPMRYLLRRMALFIPIVVMLSLSFPISQGFAAGWHVMAAILFRSTLAFMAVLWLINVMPFEQLLVTLRSCRVPAVLIAMLAFMYRYSFVVWDEMGKMQTARKARTFRGGFALHWKSAIQLIGLLLIRAMGRAERVHGAMCARGWDGRVRSLRGDEGVRNRESGES